MRASYLYLRFVQCVIFFLYHEDISSAEARGRSMEKGKPWMGANPWCPFEREVKQHVSRMPNWKEWRAKKNDDNDNNGTKGERRRKEGQRWRSRRKRI